MTNDTQTIKARLQRIEDAREAAKSMPFIDIKNYSNAGHDYFIVLASEAAWLLQLAKDAVAMAEFYAKPANWHSDDYDYKQIKSSDMSTLDGDEDPDRSWFGGKRARDFLAKIGEGKK